MNVVVKAETMNQQTKWGERNGYFLLCQCIINHALKDLISTKKRKKYIQEMGTLNKNIKSQQMRFNTIKTKLNADTSSRYFFESGNYEVYADALDLNKINLLNVYKEYSRR